MAWNYDDDEINGVIDSNIKDSPPNPPAVNTAATMRSMLKLYWAVIRDQVSKAVNYVDLQISTTIQTINLQLLNTLTSVENRVSASEQKVETIYSQFSLASGLGTYNAATGVATIKETNVTYTPVVAANQANGKYFDVVVNGTQSITGTPVLMEVGGVLISRGTKWDYIPKNVELGAKVTANEAAIKDLPIKTNNNLPGIVGEIMDEYGYMIAKFLADGSTEFLKLISNNFVAGDLQFVTSGTDQYYLTKTKQFAFVITDENGYIFKGTRSDGTELNLDTIRPIKKYNPFFAADIVHILSYGQSLSIGVNNTAITLLQKYASLMFKGGVVTWAPEVTIPADKYASLIPLVEKTAADTGETPISGFLELVIDRISQENAIAYDQHDFNHLGSAAGIGSQPITTLNKGTANYNNMLLDITNGLALANALGKTYNVPVVCWTQGENETTSDQATATYVGKFKNSS